MRWFWFALLVTSLATAAQAQLRHGPRLGLGLATRSTGFMQQTGIPKPGILAGWGVDIPLKAGLKLMTDLLYVNKGSASRNVYVKENYIYYLNYAELPLMLKLDTDKKDGGFFISVGLYGAYLLRSRFLHTLDGRVIHDIKYDLSESTDRFDYGAGFGFGLEGRRMSFEVRGESGLSFFDPVLRFRNTMYAIHAAYRFPGRKTISDRPIPATEEIPTDEE